MQIINWNTLYPVRGRFMHTRQQQYAAVRGTEQNAQPKFALSLGFVSEWHAQVRTTSTHAHSRKETVTAGVVAHSRTRRNCMCVNSPRLMRTSLHAYEHTHTRARAAHLLIVNALGAPRLPARAGFAPANGRIYAVCWRPLPSTIPPPQLPSPHRCTQVERLCGSTLLYAPLRWEFTIYTRLLRHMKNRI